MMPWEEEITGFWCHCCGVCIMGGCYVDLVAYGAGLQTFMPIQAVITLHDTNIVRSVIDRGLKVLCFVQEATEWGKTQRPMRWIYGNDSDFLLPGWFDITFKITDFSIIILTPLGPGRWAWVCCGPEAWLPYHTGTVSGKWDATGEL